MLNIALVVGTRPEAIKLGPVYRALTESGRARPIAVLSGQHGAILEPLMQLFGLDRRIALDVQPEAGGLCSFAGRLMEAMGHLFNAQPFDAVVVQGDTTSALIAALSGVYRKVPVAHVEAGLRTADLNEPFPEEINRRVISRVARWHFAPTPLAVANLAGEGLTEQVFMVGNTVVDAAEWTVARPETAARVQDRFSALAGRPYVIVTAHRRESFGRPMHAIGEAVGILADRYPGIDFIVPLHPNPNASEPLRTMIGTRPNAHLTEPLPYQLMIGLIANALAILTDSGGLQEEAPTFGVPVLVLRNITERPEGIEAGCSTLVGTDTGVIVSAFQKLLAPSSGKSRTPVINPYGDGQSARRICDTLVSALA